MVKRTNNGASLDGAGSILSTIAGPSDAPPPASLGTADPIAEQLLRKVVADGQLAAAMPFNPTKPLEYGEAARTPHAGATHTPATPLATASTSTETVASPKVGAGRPAIGANPLDAPLDRARVDDSGQRLTTNQGVPVADNQDSLKIGRRGGGLGIEVPPPLPLATDRPIHQYEPSPSLSLLSYPSRIGARTRKVALLVASGVDGAQVRALYAALLGDGVVPRVQGAHLGKVASVDGAPLDVEISLETGPSVLYDGVIVPDGDASSATLSGDAQALDFLREQYRHGKPMLALGCGAGLLDAAGIPPALPDGQPDRGLIISDGTDLAAALAAFKAALEAHRVYARETDPPRV